MWFCFVSEFCGCRGLFASTSVQKHPCTCRLFTEMGELTHTHGPICLYLSAVLIVNVLAKSIQETITQLRRLRLQQQQQHR